ncbi:MAG TPA: hypothetical protein VLM79_08215 [Kofleriaceae bacterium]|nr:hypothetical protein [Kofleriaceae bacterium]
MVRRFVPACLVLALAGALARDAAANGRPPATASITFRQGHDSDVAVGLTFGLLVSHDSGNSWEWICEDAIGYSGPFDPKYAFASSGALFASTFNGLRVMRDSCTFDATPLGSALIATDLFGPDQTLYAAASQQSDPGHGIAADFNVYRSTNDGKTFPTKGQPPGDVSWWQSLAIAPSDAQRLYLSGYRFVENTPGAGTRKEQVLFRSDTGGASWTELSLAELDPQPMQNSLIDIAGISKTDADHVYLRIEAEDDQTTESIYRSTDKGAHWTKILHTTVPIPAFLVRANGDLIAGTQALGTQISHDDGMTWMPLDGAPHMNCLVENSAHELWACTQNFGSPVVPSDDAGIMKTTDLVNWTKVLRYQDLQNPVTCAAGTIQRDTCATLWCGVCQQLGCTPPASYGCVADAPPPPAKGGCCDGSPGGPGALALGLAIGTLLLRPRRRVVS